MPTNSKIQIVILATVLLIKIKMCTFIFEAGNQLCFLKENKCVSLKGENCSPLGSFLCCFFICLVLVFFKLFMKTFIKFMLKIITSVKD